MQTDLSVFLVDRVGLRVDPLAQRNEVVDNRIVGALAQVLVLEVALGVGLAPVANLVRLVLNMAKDERNC